MKLITFIQFCRPHTIVATTLQVVSLFLLVGGGLLIEIDRWPVLVLAWASALGANIYVVGLNQLVDVEIDQINKPYLPLASGAFSMEQGRWIVVLAGILALGLAVTQGIFLLLTVIIILIIGTIYSLPPVYLKGRPVWAALSIAFARGFIANFGIFLHFHQLLWPETAIPWLLVVGLATFFFGFGLVIALFKDIPDLHGDKRYGVRTFTVRLGPEKVFRTGRWILTGFLSLPILLAVSRLSLESTLLLLITQSAILFVFWWGSWDVDPAESSQVTRFYMLLWGLFYAEYVLLGLQAIIRG